MGNKKLSSAIDGFVITNFTLSTIPSAADLAKTARIGTRFMLRNGEILTLVLANGAPILVAGDGLAQLQDSVHFVKPVTGDNKADGLTPATAWQDFLGGSKANLPAMVGAKSRVFVIEAGTNVMPSGNTILPVPINPQDQASGAGESFVIDARGALVITDVRAVVAPIPFGGLTYNGTPLARGTLVRMITGASAGQYAEVKDTVAGAPNMSVLFLALFGGIGVGDTFEVLQQGYTLDMSAGGFFIGAPGAKGVFSTIGMNFIGGYGAGIRSNAWSPAMCTLDTQGGGFTGSDRGGDVGSFGIPSDLNDGTMFAVPNLRLSGLAGPGKGGSINCNVDTEFAASILADDTAIYCEQGCSLNIFPFSLRNSPVQLVQPRWVSMFGFAPFPGLDSEMTGMLPGFQWNLDSFQNVANPTAALRVAAADGSATGPADFSVGLATVRVEKNAADGVRVDHGGRLVMQFVTTDPVLANQNTGAGLVVAVGGSVSYDEATATGPNPLTGSAGGGTDALLDGDSYKWAVIAAQVGPAVGLDGNGNVLSKRAVIDSRGSVISLD